MFSCARSIRCHVIGKIDLPSALHGRTARWYSTRPILRASNEDVGVDVKIGLDKHVHLAIRQPPKPELNAPIIIHLHPGISLTSALPSISNLAIGANAVTVRLEYQVSAKHPYPFPIHSVLAGYDWVRRNLLPHSQGQETQRSPQIGVCGELIGGSLALMLALTECNSKARGAIRAAAVRNPIVDWSALVEPEKDVPLKAKKKIKSTSSPKSEASLSKSDEIISLNQLLNLRRQVFSRPEKYFDPFASPLLFFRTPKYAHPERVISGLRSSHLPAFIASDEPLSDEEPFEPPLIKKRLAHRAYPPLGIDLVLPPIRLDTSEDHVLKEQGVEMIELMRRSLMRRIDPSDRDDEERFTLVKHAQQRLWDDKAMLEVGTWLGEKLRKS